MPGWGSIFCWFQLPYAVGEVASPERPNALLARDTCEHVCHPGVSRHFAADDLGIGILSLDY
jgi:hypothetical protein